jgi:hypothetical protein
MIGSNTPTRILDMRYIIAVQPTLSILATSRPLALPGRTASRAASAAGRLFKDLALMPSSECSASPATPTTSPTPRSPTSSPKFVAPQQHSENDFPPHRRHPAKLAWELGAGGMRHDRCNSTLGWGGRVHPSAKIGDGAGDIDECLPAGLCWLARRVYR